MLAIRSILSASLLALCSAGSAYAAGSADYRASMTLPNGLPQLLTGNPAIDGPQSLAGSWTNDGTPDAYIRARDVIGYTVDPVTNQSTPTYGETRGAGTSHTKGGPLNTMREAYNHVPTLGDNSGAQANVSWNSTSASARIVDTAVRSDVESNATWNRNFSIDPLTTFTFSVLSTLSVLGDAAPLITQSAYNLDLANSFASLTTSDLTGRLRNTIGASINSLLPIDLSGVFGYSFGPDGLMSLTVTNTSASALTGTLSAGSYVSLSAIAAIPTVAAPVPEPAAVLSMLAGLGLVGAAVSRRRKSQGSAALTA